MDFAFSKSEKLLIDSAREFLEKEAEGLARQVEETGEGYSPELWRKMADLGWMGIMLPEEYGGFAGDFLELILILEKIGRALVPGPFISTMISGYSVLQYGTEAQRNELLPKLAQGELILSSAFIEPDSTKGEVKIKEQIKLKNGDYILSGTRLFVPYAHLADWFVYKTKTDTGTILFLVNAKSTGVDCKPLKTIASDMQCEVSLDKVKVPQTNILGKKEQGKQIASEIEEWGSLCQSAFILGILEKVLEITVKHAKERKQFGRPIGSFQAIQHQCADMATEVDKVKFLVYQAAWRLSEQISATKDISMAKAKASDASRSVCLFGIKIHGGIGISEEHDMQLYFRMAKAAEIAFGNGDFHKEIVSKELGL
jgi:alkylation response protein AidB-like acyl-CoA dehydrogenase